MLIIGKIFRNFAGRYSSDKKPLVIFTQSIKCSSYTVRTHTCGELGLGHVGARVSLAGWLSRTRLDKFLLLRDRKMLLRILNIDLFYWQWVFGVSKICNLRILKFGPYH